MKSPQTSDQAIKDEALSQYALPLLDALLSGSSIQDMVELAFEYLEHPVMLFDARLNLISSSGCSEATRRPDFPKEIANELAWAPIISGLLKEICSKEMPNSTIHLSSDPEGGLVAVVEFFIEKRTFAYIALLKTTKSNVSLNIELLQLFEKVFIQRFQSREFNRSMSDLLKERLIKDLLEEKIDKNNIADKLTDLGLGFSENIFVLCFSADLFLLDEFLNVFKPEIEALSRRMNGDAWFIPYGNVTVLVLNCAGRMTPQDKPILRISTFLRKNRLHGGISQCFSDPMKLMKHYDQAIYALQTGKRLVGQNELYFYDDYSLDHFLSIRKSEDQLERFCHRSIIQLMEYDSAHDTEYLNLLETHLSTGRVLSQTAKSMYIHRSTVSQYLDRIEKLMNIDLNDQDTVFHLTLSLKILHHIDMI